MKNNVIEFPLNRVGQPPRRRAALNPGELHRITFDTPADFLKVYGWMLRAAPLKFTGGLVGIAVFALILFWFLPGIF